MKKYFKNPGTKIITSLLTVTFTLITTHAFAWTCPRNFNPISVGDSVDEVIKQCGKPDAQKTYKLEGNVPQEWTYYVQVSPPNPATMKLSVMFSNNVVVNISTNAFNLASTQLCGQAINIGDKMETVRGACGSPALINKNQESEEKNTIETTELKYDTTPAVTLVFENSKLTARQ